MHSYTHVCCNDFYTSWKHMRAMNVYFRSRPREARSHAETYIVWLFQTWHVGLLSEAEIGEDRVYDIIINLVTYDLSKITISIHEIN